ncbi:MAG: hypothetical protein QGH06_03610 [Lutibacter sp.]|jgi:heme/copper-type cytochrome/quinol oxidase subunit 2|nr:hypothetical protein [Lutibacter sp.]
MFSKGQLIFAVLFVLAFTLLMIWSYRKDLAIHRRYYKNTLAILIAVFLVIAIFTLLTFSLH